MCGRYTLATPAQDLRHQYGIDFDWAWRPRYNIAPSQDVPIVVLEGGERRARFARWGLVPSWAKETTIGNRLINARSETAREKPSFRAAYKARRCLVLADGWYEWQPSESGRIPHWIRATAAPVAFAGLWEVWRGELLTCSILTTAPTPQIAHIHDRMPVVLEPGEWDAWLAGTPEDAGELLRPYRGELAWHAVSRLVNSPRNDVPACIEPAQDGEGD